MTVSKNILQQKKLKILLVGDSCIDEYVYGDCDRLNPEAPVPILQISNIVTNLGMAANVKNLLTAFDADVNFYTGNEISVKRRFIDNRSKQHIVRVDDDKINKPIDIDKLQGHSADAVVISDYCKGLLDYYNMQYICQTYKDIPIFIDTKKTDLAKFSHANVYVKINEPEYLRAKTLPKNLIVTLGKKGAMFVREQQESYFAADSNVDVVDVCGAGDTFLSALTIRYLQTMDIGMAINYANRAAAINVTHRGAYCLTKEDITGIEYA